MKGQRNYHHQSKITGLRSALSCIKAATNHTFCFDEMPILCWIPSLWCPSTHLWRTKIIFSKQPCTDWFQLFLWKFYIHGNRDRVEPPGPNLAKSRDPLADPMRRHSRDPAKHLAGPLGRVSGRQHVVPWTVQHGPSRFNEPPPQHDLTGPRQCSHASVKAQVASPGSKFTWSGWDKKTLSDDVSNSRLLAS